MTELWVSLVIFSLALTAGTILQSRFYRGMARQFPAIWETLGKPTMMQDLVFLDSFDNIQWLYRRGFLRFEDSPFSAYCERYRWPLLCLYLACVLALLSLLFSFRIFFSHGSFSF